MIFFAAMPRVLMRRVPAVRPVAATVSATAASISRITGAIRSWRRDPAGVGATLRVVRLSNRGPRRASRGGIVWLRGDGGYPRGAAGRAELARSTTAGKALKRAKWDPVILDLTLNRLITFQ